MPVGQQRGLTPVSGGNYYAQQAIRGFLADGANYLLVEAIGRFARFFGDDFAVEHPTGSGDKRTLAEVAADLNDRLISTFRNDSAGRRPVFGDYELFQTDPHWHDQLWFHEDFHGE